MSSKQIAEKRTKSVEAEIEISKSPQEVVDQFLSVEGMCTWWGADRGLIMPEVGGIWVMAWNVSKYGFMYVSTGVISKYEPAKSLVISHYTNLNPEHPNFGPMTLSIECQPKNNGALLKLVQDGYQESTPSWNVYYEATVQCWPRVLNDLKTYLEGGVTGSNRESLYPQIHL